MATDNDVIKGGPVADGSAAPGTEGKKTEPKAVDGPVVKMVEVEIGGVKANVPESFVAEYNAMHKGFSDLRAEVEALKKPKPTKKDGESDPNDPLANIETELFADPKAAVAKIIKAAREMAVGEVTSAQVAREGQREFWDAFYKANPDLDPSVDGDVISAVLTREFDELKTLKVPAAIKLLSEKSKAQLLKIAEKRGGGKGSSGKPDGEGGNEGSKKGSKAVDQSASTHSTGLSGAIRARQAARRAAAKG